MVLMLAVVTSGCGGEQAVTLADTNPVVGSDERAGVPQGEWPAFSADFVEHYPQIDDSLGSRTTWRVVHDGLESWSMQVLAGVTLGDDSAPGEGWVQVHQLPGTKVVFDGDRMVQVDPDGERHLLGADAGPSAPNHWLQPRYHGAEWSFRQVAGGRYEGRRTNVFPCDGGDVCARGVQVERVTLDPSGIPVRVTETVDGRVVFDVEMTSLTID